MEIPSLKEVLSKYDDIPMFDVAWWRQLASEIIPDAQYDLETLKELGPVHDEANEKQLMLPEVPLNPNYRPKSPEMSERREARLLELIKIVR